MNIIEIDRNETLYKSVSTANLNSMLLDSKVADLQPYVELWKDLASFYIDFKNLLKNSSTFSQTYSSLFFETATLVESNSTTWLKPITIFYPTLIPNEVSLDVIKTTVLNWVETRYPVFTEELINAELPVTYADFTPNTINVTYLAPQQEYPKYVEGQSLIVYAHRWSYGSSIVESQYLYDYTICQTADATICAHCINRYYGYVYCSNGDFNCSGHSNSCQTCKTITCNYNTPPYYSYIHFPDIPEIQFGASSQSSSTVSKLLDTIDVRYFKNTINRVTRWVSNAIQGIAPPLSPSNKRVYSQIVANVEMSFIDRNENSNIVAMLFKIENCKWVFKNYL